jgi:hypothetical protein
MNDPIKELRDRINDDNARIRSAANDIIGPTWEELVGRQGNHPKEISIKELRDKIKYRAIVNRVVNRVVNKEMDTAISNLGCFEEYHTEDDDHFIPEKSYVYFAD